ncbi:hypothetical protein [Lichenihabitans psoromatis]|uniref:hypothetical protein n=1 Tax=Lichenihabitans psoromatis TaxID=2528642 RepID=UPI001FDF2910|nr:hypothetical protein [Lichenihabitans psoromatis]
MARSTTAKTLSGLIAAAAIMGLSAFGSDPASAQSVMQQCGQQYQAAKAANTLGGMTWNQFRADCSAKLKAQPASASVTPAAATPAAPPTAAAANPLKPAPTVPPVAAAPAAAPMAAPATTTASAPAATPVKAQSAGRTAFVARERQCGTEWKANKVALKAQTPGITWPKYLSQCNTRLKAAGQ